MAFPFRNARVKPIALLMRSNNITKYHGAEYISLTVFNGSKLLARRNRNPINRIYLNQGSPFFLSFMPYSL
jgi:hypothetical protein